MATTIRGSLGGREKRGTSPSTPLTKKSLKSPSQPLGSSSTSSAKNLKTSSSSTDGKSVPNYLKPTRTTNVDTGNNTAKRPGTDSTQKPLINRRRSFDRPPPTSQVQKAIRNVPVTREVKPVRSTSFSHKIGTSSLAPSTKPASDRSYARTTSSLKDGKIEPTMSKTLRTIKKSTFPSANSTTTKKDKNGLKSSLYAKKAPNSSTSESSTEHDTQLIDQLVDEDDLVNMDIEVQSLPEMSEMPDTDQELGDPGIILADVEQKPVENVDFDQVVEDTTVVDVDDKTEETEEEPAVEIQPETQNSEEQDVTDEEQNATVEEDHVNVTVEEDHVNVTAEEEHVSMTDDEEPKPVEAEEQNVSATADDSEELNVAQTVTTEPPPPEEKKAEAETENKEKKNESASVARPAQATVVKKDKQDYNDVIEETATKLMGGRKNKVLALAGAFETVISLQDTSKN